MYIIYNIIYIYISCFAGFACSLILQPRQDALLLVQALAWPRRPSLRRACGLRKICVFQVVR